MNLASFTRRLHRLAERIDKRVSRTVLTYRAQRVYKSRPHPIRLHVGCGSVHLEGWVQTDYFQANTADFAWDASLPYPLPDGSCQFIFNEHFLEHIPLDIARRFLADCHRMLVPGGVLRVAMPSLEVTVQKYCSENWRDQDWLYFPDNAHIATRCEMLNTALRGWGHQWLYDREELHRYLKAAGFAEIRDVIRGESVSSELCGLETRADSFLICEGVK